MNDAPVTLRVRRSRLQAIWLIPLVAALIAGFLAWRGLSERGPMITITFHTADGLVAGQTRVKHKAVDLGTVESIRLSDDLSHVDVSVRMRREAERHLTDHARFWVARPRLTPGSISGLETIVSGAYIELDPGAPGGTAERSFTGLDEPPAVRSDEPGRSFVLKAGRIGSLGPGSPVFWRDVAVGEVLSYDVGDGSGPVTVNVFVRAPYDRSVRAGSRWWNASGLSLQVGPEGVHVELASLQALLSGGVAFDTPPDARATAVSEPGAEFPLYADQAAADASGFRERDRFVSYFRSAARGLGKDARVEMYGIQVGVVTDVRLQMNLDRGEASVRVAYEVQPERIFGANKVPPGDPTEITRRLVAQGLRASLRSGNLVTGQQVLSLDFVPDASPATMGREGEEDVIPTTAGGGLDDITAALSSFTGTLNRLPLDEIARNLNATLASVSAAVGGDELRNAVRSLSATLASVQDLTRKADAGLTPTLKRLPEIASGLEEAVARANRALGSVERGYGGDSEVKRGLERLLAQANDAARSVRILADFLDRHPEALVRGRAGGADR